MFLSEKHAQLTLRYDDARERILIYFFDSWGGGNFTMLLTELQTNEKRVKNEDDNLKLYFNDSNINLMKQTSNSLIELLLRIYQFIDFHRNLKVAVPCKNHTDFYFQDFIKK